LQNVSSQKKNCLCSTQKHFGKMVLVELVHIICFGIFRQFHVDTIHCKKGVKFPSEFWSAWVGQNLTYFLPKKQIFVLFDLLFWFSTSKWPNLFNPSYLWASGCLFWLSSFGQKSQCRVKKCLKLAWNIDAFL